MASRPTRAQGFSMVELLVALVFTMILMAGMASVFKASLSAYVTSGEKLSSIRRNRMGLDLIADDLNNAGMYLTDLVNPPSVSSSNPPLRIVPNPSTITGVTQGADELYFYMDEPLPFEGTIASSSSSSKSASELVAAESAASSTDYTFTIECGESAYARMVAAGQVLIFKDSWEIGYVSATPTVSGSTVTVVLGSDSSSSITGSGTSGLPTKANHLKGSQVLFVKPAQLVKYSVQTLQLDPASSSGLPCLVRDQGAYSTSGFTADSSERQIVTENVTGFRVYMSVNSGQTWIGGSSYSGWSAIRSALDTALTTYGRADYQTTESTEHWFRAIPVLMRLDVTTRTARQRTEYASTAGTSAYKEETRSVVMVPRHFGLAMN